MASPLSNLVNDFSEGIHKMKCKYGHDDKKCETCGITYKVCDCFLEYVNLKDDLIEYKCLCFSKIYQQKFDGKLRERFLNTYKFSNHDNNKFISLLRKGVYPYDFMDDWENSDETSLPEKEALYNQLNMKDIIVADYAHAKRVCKDFKLKDSGKYCDLYVQSNTILLANAFEDFRNMCLKIYELDPARFLSPAGLVQLLKRLK